MPCSSSKYWAQNVNKHGVRPWCQKITKVLSDLSDVYRNSLENWCKWNWNCLFIILKWCFVIISKYEQFFTKILMLQKELLLPIFKKSPGFDRPTVGLITTKHTGSSVFRCLNFTLKCWFSTENSHRAVEVLKHWNFCVESSKTPYLKKSWSY